MGRRPFYVEFIIKVYFPLPPKFPNGGILTQHMETLKVHMHMHMHMHMHILTQHVEALHAGARLRHT